MNDQPPVLTRCPLCHAGVETTRVVATYPELTWVRCDCGLIYKRSEHPDPAAVDFYEGGYFGTGEQGRKYTQRRKRRVQKSRNQILDLLNHAPPGPLLDIGCSMGYALEQYRALGFRAERGELGRLPFADGEFGLVTMKHVLEHTPDPRAALREVRRVLRPGGGLFIAIPHGGYGKSLRRPQESQFYLPARHGREHFVYYTPATLTRLLEGEGFRVARVNPALLHRRAGAARRVGEALAAPFRALGQALVDVVQARKEFWLVAVRPEA